jgi:hypothetical protein
MKTSKKPEELLAQINEIVRNESPETLLSRSDILPLLFKVRGVPYSLDGYPQFKEMYSSLLPRDMLLMCGRQLGKSMNLSRSEVLDCLTIPFFQILYVAPLQSQTQRYSTLYLKEAIGTCTFAQYIQMADSQGESRIVKSVMHQTFYNDSGIQLTYAKTSSDRARGIYADRIDFDEIQDQLIDNIPVITESLTASSWGLRRFTGTAKTTDNTIESLWQDSSQSEWVMRCSGCNHWNIPNLDGKIMDMIHVDGLRCVKCGKRLDVRAGQFVPAYPDRVPIFSGYHIPQIVVPAIVENPDKWSALFRKIMHLPLPIILQEVMGISCSIGARIITQADIDRQSTLPSMKELQKRAGRYAFTVGGVDWGIAEHDSFTVHTIIGIAPDGQIDVLWARRFIGFDPEETLKAIAQAHTFYGCRMLAADFGMGFDKNFLLANRFGIPVVQMQYVRQNKLLGYSALHSQARWTVDKTTALELLFLAIKYGRISFPLKEEFDNFTADLLSPYEEISEAGGITTRHFLRNPNRPDDFCHALCFATMLAMRLMGEEISNIVPQDAFGAQSMPGTNVAPTQEVIDPMDILPSVH